MSEIRPRLFPAEEALSSCSVINHLKGGRVVDRYDSYRKLSNKQKEESTMKFGKEVPIPKVHYLRSVQAAAATRTTPQSSYCPNHIPSRVASEGFLS